MLFADVDKEDVMAAMPFHLIQDVVHLVWQQMENSLIVDFGFQIALQFDLKTWRREYLLFPSIIKQ